MFTFGQSVQIALLEQELVRAQSALAKEKADHCWTQEALAKERFKLEQRKQSSLAASTTENDAYRGTMRAIGEVAEMFIPGEYTATVAARIAKLAKEKR